VRLLNVPSLHTRRATTVFITVYLILRVATSVLETHYVGGTGFSPFRIGSGLDIVLFLVYGWRFWPLPVVAGIVRMLLFPQGLHASWALNLEAGVPMVLWYAIATKIAVDTLRIHFPLRSLRDVWVFAGWLGLAAPLVYALIGTVVFTLGGRFLLSDLPMQFERVMAGEITSIIVVVPILTQILAWKENRSRPWRSSADLWIGLAATLVVVVAEFAAGAHLGRPIVELSFVPLAWLAIRHGMKGAVLGILVADVSTAVLQSIFGVPISRQIQFEAYLFATALMALLLGAVTGERNVLDARLARRSQFDDLTDLPNRERLVAWIETNRNNAIVVVMLDIDDMRLLNEGVGRRAADRILRDFASRLRAGLPSSYFVARVDADEFAIAVVDERSPHAVIAEVRQLLEAPFEIDDARIFVAASAGAVRMARSNNVEEVLRRADLALHRAKSTSNRTAIYTPELQTTSVPLLVVELHRAVERGELVPFFQPIFWYDRRVARWSMIGAEALLRWIHPDRGVIAPDQFIDLLGRLSVGDRAGWEVMERSLRLAKQWRRQSPDFRIWVNLFARQALDPACVRRIRDLLLATDTPASALVVEINERTVVSEERDISGLAQELRAIGVTTAIDDFGTGGSSLGRIRDVPAQVLKIDRSFVSRSEVDAKARAVAAAVVRLGTDLGMAVVAEGVENAMQVEAMIEAGCEFAQGYALGHPVPDDLFERLLTESAAV
jgi:diguanylate cyclase (GGDEF)-like protein